MSAELRLAADPREGPQSRRQTVKTLRTVLIVIHNVTTATRLMDVLPIIGTDRRIQLLFSATDSTAFSAGVEEFMRERAITPVDWSRLPDLDIDLAIAASYGGKLRELRVPVAVMPHGMGYNKYSDRETGKQGNRETGKQGNRETGKQGNRETGLSSEWLIEDGELIPSAMLLSHPEQLERLRAATPEATEVAIVSGDPCLDRMLASRPLRPIYRRALGAEPGRRLVVISSTWADSSLLGADPDFVPRLAAQLPLDEYRIVVALHPNIWSWHTPWQVRMWLDGCRRAGVRVLPPEDGWQAALVGADLVIGDHGSVTFYAAALGHPVLLASAPHDQLDPRSPVAQLVAAAPLFDPAAEPIAQLETAITEHDPATLRHITELATSQPGRAAELWRAAIYRLLDLPEPAGPAETRAVPVPAKDLAAVGAQLVKATIVTGRDGALVVEVVRHPAELLRGDAPSAPLGHLVVDSAEPFRRWLELADVIVVPEAADLSATLDGMPGCLLGTASTGDHEWQVTTRAGQSVRFSSITVDGRICASLVHAWLAAARPLAELPDRLGIRLGSTSATVEISLD